MAAFLALIGAGFRRWSTYRQATVAAAVTNTVFGFLKCSVLLAVAAGAGGAAAGYHPEQLATFVWAGQGLIGVVLFWGATDLADRVRSGDVVSDLLRPVDPVWSYLAGDLGRAGHAALARFVLPMVVGAMFFDLSSPARPATYPMFALSVLLATVVSFACRHLVNVSAFWLLDVRGVYLVWATASGVLSGMYFPIWFLPGWLSTALWVATPFPALYQAPLDVLVERGGVTAQLAALGGQLAWVAVMLTVARLVQRAALRKLVVQGG